MPRFEKKTWQLQFAKHAGLTQARALRILKSVDAAHGGALLSTSFGSNRRYTFAPAQLRQLCPEYFEPLEDVESRLKELEETLERIADAQRIIATQTGANTRKLEALASVARTAARAELARQERARRAGQTADSSRCLHFVAIVDISSSGRYRGAHRRYHAGHDDEGNPDQHPARPG